MTAMLKFTLVLFVFLYIDSCKTENFTLGVTTSQIAYSEHVQLMAVPFVVRTKNVFYGGSQAIKGITAIELVGEDGEVKVTAGGVGFTFANVKLKSERGYELNYHVQIFV